jgi:hypothetical protein
MGWGSRIGVKRMCFSSPGSELEQDDRPNRPTKGVELDRVFGEDGDGGFCELPQFLDHGLSPFWSASCSRFGPLGPDRGKR